MTPTMLVEITEEGADPVRLDQLSRQLLGDLRRHGVQTERAAGQAPPGAKSASSVVFGVVVALAGTSTTKALVDGLFAWLGPRRGSVRLTYGDKSIELSSVTAKEQRRLIEWLRTCETTTSSDQGD